MPNKLLNSDLITFITSGISITLASRNQSNVPSIARAKGCVCVGNANEKIRLFVSTSQAAQLIDDIRSTKAISVTFSDPNSHRTIQLKAFDAAVLAISDSELLIVEQYVERFCDHIEPLGFPRQYTRAFLDSPADIVALEFTPTDAFQQSPGPNAGARL